MTLIKSISGIRGTIGGELGNNLTPLDIVKFVSAYAQFILESEPQSKIILGRDARISGEMVKNLVAGTLQGMGLDVIDLGLATTPTVEMVVARENAGGGIILTASHNPIQWNALKLLNGKGEFLSAEDGEKVLTYAESGKMDFATVHKIGSYTQLGDGLDFHINALLNHDLVKPDIIKKANFTIAVDAVNSIGGVAVPALLKALGVENIIEVNCEPHGNFAHNPEPLPEHLNDIRREVMNKNADLGIVVDPDVDRLAFICEDGEFFGEEYTLVALAKYYLNNKPGNTVSNLSSTKALKEITEAAGYIYQASAVGEVNVVEAMKANSAVIGGEGNGGIIIPELHYGRDALAGIALFLTYLAEFNKPVSMLRAQFPNYHISKNKITLSEGTDLESVFKQVKEKYQNIPMLEIDGLKLFFEEDWVHLRKSNTEPIIRIYAESDSETVANSLSNKIIADIKELIHE